MFAWLTLAILAAAATAVTRVPRGLRRGYLAAFPGRHGLMVQLGLTILGTITVSILIATLLDPGARPLMEIVDGVVVGSGLVVGAIDLYLFARGSRGSPPRA